MAYFPMFIDLEGARVLVVGGGCAARQKAERLLPYGARITVFAAEAGRAMDAQEIEPGRAADEQSIQFSEAWDRLRKMGIELQPRAFCEADLEPAPVMVLVADVPMVEKRYIARLCRERQIPVNVVDEPALCSFYFPSLIKRGALSVGISTGGASPATAAYLRRKMEAQLPECMEELLLQLAQLRPVLREQYPKEEQRRAVLADILTYCMENDRVLDEKEVKMLTEAAKGIEVIESS